MPRQAPGPRPLSRQEWLVMCCWVNGMTYRQIGSSLFISPHTVHGYVKRAREKRGGYEDRVLFDPGPAPVQAKARTRKL